MAAKGSTTKKRGGGSKKPSARARAAARTAGGSARNRPKGGGAIDPVGVPKGPRLNAAQQSIRDSWIMARIAQGWTWEEAAKEAGIAVKTAKEAVRRRKQVLPNLLEQDPVKIVEEVIQAFQSDAGDFEKMAAAYAESNPSAAIGAKKAAQDARWRMMVLMQSLGILPRQLGTLRHLVEIRGVVGVVIGAVDDFEEAVRGMKLPKAKREEILEASGAVRKELEEVAGGGRGSNGVASNGS